MHLYALYNVNVHVHVHVLCTGRRILLVCSNIISFQPSWIICHPFVQTSWPFWSSIRLANQINKKANFSMSPSAWHHPMPGESSSWERCKVLLYADSSYIHRCVHGYQNSSSKTNKRAVGEKAILGRTPYSASIHIGDWYWVLHVWMNGGNMSIYHH